MSSIWLFLALCEIFVYVHGWGPVGHSIIARLAQSQLTGAAKDRIRYLVPWHWNGNLSAMASWGDDILYPNTNPTGFDNWQWSRPLHYINMPEWSCNYRRERDCINDICVDGAIRNYTERLETDLGDIQHQEALYFLIHFVGDIHQPLHVGFANDYGGNNIRGRFMNVTTQTNLHSLWDSGLITVRVRRDFQSNNSLYYDYIHDLMLQRPLTDNDDDILQWIEEDIDLVCSQVYLNEQNTTMNASVNFQLGESYYQRNIPAIEQRLALGGRRLGALLNRLKQPSSTIPSPTIATATNLSLITYILIGIIVVEFIVVVILGICCIRRRPKH